MAKPLAQSFAPPLRADAAILNKKVNSRVMSIVLTNLSMIYGNKVLFNEVDLKFTGKSRYALVGANGVGKSTLMRLITGEEEASDGSIGMPKFTSIGWLKQDQFRYEDTRIIDIVLQGKPELWEAMEAKERIFEKDEFTEEDGMKLAALEEKIAHLDGYRAEALAEKLLVGLGIANDYHRKPLSALSGGFKLRVLMAQTLFLEPEILLLDEPTNHLDIVTIAWLERYLKNEFSGLLVFISHDTDFIDSLAEYIVDIDYGEIRQYSGNYKKFLAEKKLIAEQKIVELASAEKQIAHLQKFVDRFKAKASKAKQAQSRVKMIEKIELPDVKKSSRKAPHFDFSPKRPSGKLVLKVERLCKSYGEKEIFKNLNFEIRRGDKVAIIGANGMGKSTLIKSMLEIVPHDQGELTWGHETQISYFSQDHHDALNRSISVKGWAAEEIKGFTEQDVRKTLGRMLFSQDDVNKNILNISGGEAARLLLAKMMMEHGNVLMIDEPTNHMDIETIDALARSLKKFPATVVSVSHNRHFIRKFADRIIYLSPEGFDDFKGSYDEFEELLEAE